MATFVRNHPTATASTSGTAVATSLSAAVSAGNTLIATLVVADESPAVTGLSKPGGETASWALLNQTAVTNGDADDRARIEVWAIKTTIGWASAQVITATWGAAANARAIGLGEFVGVSVEVTSSETDTSSDSPLASATVNVETADTLRAGDLVFQAVITQRNALTSQTSSGTATGTRQNLADSLIGTAGSYRYFQSTAYLISSSGKRTVSYLADKTSKGALIVGLRAENYPPNAPTLTTMAAGGVLDRAATNRATHTFSDPNPGDSQSAFDLRYRIVGAPTWTTIAAPTPNQFYDFAAGSLAAGNYERQVRTYDALGSVGPWSTSGFFTAADVPAGPTITYPLNGQFVEYDETLVWSSADQDAYQVRRLGDDAGTPDEAVVYFDTGEVTSTTARSLALTFTVNARTEHVQVRVKNDGLWSAWATVSVEVSYTPPPAPVLVFATEPDTASLLVTITNPAPGEDQPAAAYNDVYIDDGDGEERKATGLPANSTWRYWTPRGLRDYAGSVRVEAVASNGTTTSS